MCPAVRFGEARPQSSRDLTADPSAGMGVASVANGIEGRDYFVVKVGEAAADWEPGCEHGSSSPWRRRPWRLDVKQPHLPEWNLAGVKACRVETLPVWKAYSDGKLAGLEAVIVNRTRS